MRNSTLVGASSDRPNASLCRHKISGHQWKIYNHENLQVENF
jgi:hypothetical protein